MIKEKKALAMYEVEKLTGDLKDTDKVKEIKAFIKKYSQLDDKKSEKLRKDLEKLDIIKLRAVDVIKIVDMLPENATELNKIFVETSLDADETNKILETIKNNK